YAYTTEEQLKFKEIYYGYSGALDKWKELNAQTDYPVCLKDYFDWVNDGSVVEDVSDKNVTCLAKIENSSWHFSYGSADKNPGILLKSDEDYARDAENAINNNDLAKARRLLNCALNISENNIDAKNNLAVIEMLDKHYENAMNILIGIINEDCNNKTAIQNKRVLEEIIEKAITEVI
ncbi:MAG: hypothetical protein P4L45_12325, partial [Ignavibacteriaceae bacterium]|nr:hypothetical protein [Ignavibacteriaceae bacterium]